jgi:hypothetical protein
VGAAEGEVTGTTSDGGRFLLCRRCESMFPRAVAFTSRPSHIGAMPNPRPYNEMEKPQTANSPQYIMRP